ncbi:FAD:protein FMN transferase [Paenibacillus ginsengarvi]|uniref:FAD:protein FMN transferase n=1 Tax=Paenibacillus ginsengarvi TaxID=400777 RepID=A0A3B0BNG7_9BACL|nr:FAD:protein FMN transferase [Paenibacillus ginsengarvi]RKN74201.1 FAD:protein FMN transferase [Paenibacillus ginsengarvi]
MRDDAEPVRERETWHSFEFQAMNTTMEAAWFGCERDEADIRELLVNELARSERMFSRFRPDSELSRLNRSAGRLCLVSPDMLELLSMAVEYGAQTDGIFCPAILDGLLAAGYTESFERLPSSVRLSTYTGGHVPSEPLRIDAAMSSVQLFSGSRIDLGGIAKSWTAAKLAQRLKRIGISRGMINAGGDLALWGGYAANAPWIVDIQHPWTEEEDAGSVAVYDGAVATSGTRGRRWMTDRGEMHHLIDPRTMLPSRSDVVQCTVAGDNPVECEIWSKTLCILGTEEGRPLYEKRKPHCSALLFLASGESYVLESDSASRPEWRM